MTWLDRDIGTCHECGTERRLFECEKRLGVWSCSPCALKWAGTKKFEALSTKSASRNAVYLRELRAKRQSEGLCKRCGVNKADVRKWCRPCVDAFTKPSVGRKTNNVVYFSKRRAQRRDMGICIDCTSPATRGLRCDNHASRASAAAWKSHLRKRAIGQCVACPSATVNGRWRCDPCRDEFNRKRREQYRSKKCLQVALPTP